MGVALLRPRVGSLISRTVAAANYSVGDFGGGGEEPPSDFRRLQLPPPPRFSPGQLRHRRRRDNDAEEDAARRARLRGDRYVRQSRSR